MLTFFLGESVRVLSSLTKNPGDFPWVALVAAAVADIVLKDFKSDYVLSIACACWNFDAIQERKVVDVSRNVDA